MLAPGFAAIVGCVRKLETGASFQMPCSRRSCLQWRRAVDSKVPQALGAFLNCLVNVLGSLVINLLVTPLVLLPLVPMAVMYDVVRRRCGSSSALLESTAVVVSVLS